MTPAPSSPNPKFSTQWKNVSRFFHTIEKMVGFGPRLALVPKRNLPSKSVRETRAPHCGKTSNRQERLFCPTARKGKDGSTSRPFFSFRGCHPPHQGIPPHYPIIKSSPTHTHFWILFYKTLSKQPFTSSRPSRVMFYKTLSKLDWKSSKLHLPSQDGFSLIELIVVIAVIAILAAITAGSWTSARAAAESATCKSNLRQLAAANLAYSVDHLMFVAAAEDIKAGSANTIRWHGVRSGGKAFDGSIGPLAPYLGNGGVSAWVRRCPGFRPEAAGFETSCGGYGYNALGVGSEVCLPGGGTAVGMKVGTIAHPAQTVMFADAAFLSGGGAKAKLIEYSFAEPPRFADGMVPWPSIHFRHRGKANVAWADGHVSAETLARTDGPSAPHALGWFGPDNNELFDPF